MRPLLIAATAILLSGPALAQTPYALKTGDQLFTVCEHAAPKGDEPDAQDRAVTYAVCYGFIWGVMNTHEAFAVDKLAKRQFCPPPMPFEVYRMAVTDRIFRHPELRKMNPVGVTIGSLRDAYPCR